jgi:hypothetical protein
LLAGLDHRQHCLDKAAATHTLRAKGELPPDDPDTVRLGERLLFLARQLPVEAQERLFLVPVPGSL